MTFCAESSIPYLDLAVLAFVIICGLVGLKKGFWMSLIALFSGLVVLIIAYFAAGPVASWLKNLDFINAWIYNDSGSIKSLIAKAFPMEQLNAAQVGDSGAVATAIMSTSFSVIGTFLIGLVSKGSFAAETPFGDALATVLTDKAFTIIVGIALFILIRIIVRLIRGAIEKARERNVMGGLTRFLGFLLGLVKGAVFVIFLMVLMFLFQEKPVLSPITAEIDKSVVIKPITTIVYDSSEKLMEKDNWLGNTLKSLRAFSLGKESNTEDIEDEITTAEQFKTAYEALLNGTEELTEEQKTEITAAYEALSETEKANIDADLTAKITALTPETETETEPEETPEA